MSAAFLFLGALILLCSVARRVYIDFTGNGLTIETYVILGGVASFGALLFLIGILLGAV